MMTCNLASTVLEGRYVSKISLYFFQCLLGVAGFRHTSCEKYRWKRYAKWMFAHQILQPFFLFLFFLLPKIVCVCAVFIL